MEFGRRFDMKINLEKENSITVSKLPIFISIYSNQFPKIKARYGDGWLSKARKLCKERSNGKPTYKIYNDCLFETKPSWLMLDRKELSDTPWTKVDNNGEHTHSLMLWDTSRLTRDLGKNKVVSYYKNKNEELIVGRFKLEETLICENSDIERIGRLLFQQNMLLAELIKRNGSSPQTLQIVNNCEMRSHSSSFCINAPISVGFCMKF